MALELIGAGLGRTGTLSLKAALERIGYGPCYHMIEVLTAPERGRHWLEQTQSGSHDWDAIFHGYRATVDWPAAAFWRELVERYPDAKVLLSRRDARRRDVRQRDHARATTKRRTSACSRRARRPRAADAHGGRRRDWAH